jgi:primary-amine oxidase
VHSSADGNELLRVEKIALEDERVKAEIAKLQLPEGAVVISDPWIYGKPAKKDSCSFSDEDRIRWHRRRALH